MWCARRDSVGVKVCRSSHHLFEHVGVEPSTVSIPALFEEHHVVSVEHGRFVEGRHSVIVDDMGFGVEASTVACANASKGTSMARFLCIARAALQPVHEAELARIAVTADVVFVDAGDSERVASVLEAEWSAIWARGVAVEHRRLVDEHPAPKLVAVLINRSQGREVRVREQLLMFDHLELVEPTGSRTIEDNEFS